MNSISSAIKRSPLVAFFVLVFALEGMVTLLLAGEVLVLPFVLVLLPTVAALVVVGVTEGGAGVLALLRTLLKWRVRPQWYVVALGLPVLIGLAIVGVAVLLGTPTGNLFNNLLPAALILPLAVLLPAFAEELGWRGYALPRLLAGRSALTASVILGIIWAAFHLPLFLPGQMNAHLQFWPVPLLFVAMSVLATWIFKHTGGSVLLVSLFHAMANGYTPLTRGIAPDLAWTLQGLVFAGAALLLIAIAGPHLAREKSAQVIQAGQAPVLAEPAAKV
jgi:membrane protease YdiL (CAAX protease family)